jgi:hypothetical protein
MPSARGQQALVDDEEARARVGEPVGDLPRAVHHPLRPTPMPPADVAPKSVISQSGLL